jgi:Domain of unknown function (DUF4340)
MNLRGLMVAALVLGTLGGILYWSQHRKTPANDANGAPASAGPTILKLNPADITQLTLAQKGADPVTLVKAKTGKWQITEPNALGADQDAVASVLSALSDLSADRVVEDKVSDVKQYGFEPPAVEVNVTENDHKTEKLLVGDDTPAGGDVYAMLGGDPRVFTFASYNKNSLDKGLNDLRDKRLMTVDSDKVSRVELLKKAQDIEFGRTKDRWQIQKPRPLRADGLAVSDLLRNITNARMDLSGAGTNDAAKDFAQATPVGTAKLTDDAGTQTLEVRKNKSGDYYAKSSSVEGVYKVDSSLGQALEKNLDDFRDKKLFDFSFNEPNKIELHSDSKVWVFTRSGEDWSSNGKKVDPGSVESLVSQLRDLTASKFIDSGFATPAIEVSVISDDGKRTEKVLISKSGKDYIAKRENESSLYKVDPSAVEALPKSADAIKPAAGQSK